jgi:hypothetical protein
MRRAVSAESEGVSAKPWMLELFIQAKQQLPEGVVEMDSYAGGSNYMFYAALRAAGCPRLAFLLTDLDPRDRLDEEIASWKAWLVRMKKRVRRVANPIEVIMRYHKGELSAETAQELLSKREEVLYEWYEGFLVSTHYLRRLRGSERAELLEEARKGDLYAAARLAVNAELERLARMAEAGFPDLPRIFDRFVDTLSELGRCLSFGMFKVMWSEYPEEVLRKWVEMGIGRWSGDSFNSSFVVEVCHSDLVPEELRQTLMDHSFSLLRGISAVVTPAHLHDLGDAFIYAHRS